MNPPVTRGARATYPVPTGRHTPEFPQQMHHAASVQFGNGSRHSANPEQLDPAVYGQYRKAEKVGQNAQHNSSRLRRSAEDGRRRVSFGEDHVKAVRQCRDKTVVRPRSVNSTTQWGTPNQAAQSGHKTVRRPRSVTFALPDEKHGHNSLTNQRKDSRTQQAGASSRPPEEDAYSRAGNHLNPSQSLQRGCTTQRGAVNTGECRGRNASYRAACSTTNQQKARAMQQIMNGYETINPVDHNRINKSYSSPPGYSEYVAMSQQNVPSGVSPQNVRQQTHRAGYDGTNTGDEGNGYEEMRPQHFNTSTARSSVTTQQNAAYSNTAGMQQNLLCGAVAAHQEQNPSNRNTVAQHRGTNRYGSTQHNPPYNTAATQPNGTNSHAARQENGTFHPVAGTAQQIAPYGMAAAQQDVTYSHMTSQQYGAYHPAASTQQNPPYSSTVAQQNGTYSHATSQQNGTDSHATSQQNGTYSHAAYSTPATHQNWPYHPATTAQQSLPYSASATQQNGTYSHATSQQNGTYSRAAYDTSATHQNGTYHPATTAQQSLPYSASATQQNGTYSQATSQQNGQYYPAATVQQSLPYSASATQQNGTYNHSAYSTAATQQNGTYSHATSQQNGTHHPAATQGNVTHSNHQGYDTANQENGYDGYDSSDSEFDDTDDEEVQYDYVNFSQWNGAENGTNDSTDSHYQQSDR